MVLHYFIIEQLSENTMRDGRTIEIIVYVSADGLAMKLIWQTKVPIAGQFIHL